MSNISLEPKLDLLEKNLRTLGQFQIRLSGQLFTHFKTHHGQASPASLPFFSSNENLEIFVSWIFPYLFSENRLETSYHWSKDTRGLHLVYGRINQGLHIHSKYNPEREAQNQLAGIGDFSLLFVYGFGMAYFHEELRKKNSDFRCICLIENPFILIELLSIRDLSTLFSDPRFVFLFTANPKSIASELKAYSSLFFWIQQKTFISSSFKKIETLSHFPFTDQIQQLLQNQSQDYLTQSKLAKQWVKNFFKNQEQPESSSWSKFENIIKRITEKSKIILLGAGSSLNHIDEDEINFIRSCATSNQDVIISSDSALSWTQFHRIDVDLLISIDPQIYSYHHFLGIEEVKALTIQDNCSPPFHGRSVLLAPSLHPLNLLLKTREYWGKKNELFLNSFGGNVGYAMLAFALDFDPGTIHSFGFDFAYIEGKTYCTPSYYHNYALLRSHRFNPLEQKEARIYLNDPESIIQKVYHPTTDNLVGKNLGYTSPRMEGYKYQWKSLIGTRTCKNPKPGQWIIKSYKRKSNDGKLTKKANVSSSIENNFNNQLKEILNNLKVLNIKQEFERAKKHWGTNNQNHLFMPILSLAHFYHQRMLNDSSQVKNISSYEIQIAALEKAKLYLLKKIELAIYHRRN